MNALRCHLLVPDTAQMSQRRLARAISAPARVRVDGGVARYVHNNGASALACRRRERTQQRAREAKRAENVGRERQREVFAFGVGQQSERHRAQARGIVYQRIETTEAAHDLQCDWMDVVLLRHVADDAVSACLCRDALDAIAMTGDECDLGAATAQLLHQRKPQARCSAGDRYASSGPLTKSVRAGAYSVFEYCELRLILSVHGDSPFDGVIIGTS